MSSSTHDDLGERILADLGRLTREKRARDDAHPAEYEPLPEQRRAAIIARLLGPESDDGNDDDIPAMDGEANASTPGSRSIKADDPNVIDDPDPRETAAALADDPDPREAAATADDGPDARPRVVPLAELGPETAANDRRWLLRAGGYLATAAAAAAVVAVVVPRDPGAGEPDAPPQAAVVDKPAFESWNIDGGGPPPEHLGPTQKGSICPTKPVRLTLALAPGHTIDPSLPLQLVLQATPSQGPGHRFVLDLQRDARFRPTPDGRALVYEGPLEQIAPLAPGIWTLEPSVGAPGSCTSEERQGCAALKARNIELEREPCDGPK